MKQVCRRLCVVMAVTAMLCTSVLPVYAEEAAETSEPKLGVAEMTWSEGALEIPIENIDVSQWSDQGNKLYVNGKEYEHGGMGIRLEKGKGENEGIAVLDIESAIWMPWNIEKKFPRFFTKKGDYKVAVELTGSEETWKSEEFTLHIPQNSQIWESPYKNAKVDGSSDITFEFQNGTGLYRITSVTGINFNVISSEPQEAVMPMAGWLDFYMEDGDGGYTVDWAKGTVTLHRERLNKEIKEWMEYTGKKPETVVAFATGNLTGGDSSCFTYWVDAEDYISSWYMDLTNFDPDAEPEEPEQEESKQITDKNSSVSMNLPAKASEGLSLKVSESNGAEEKEAVSKLVQIDGDKIKTFDLSLMKDGKVWEYNGQFKSKVTLPVPEGWNLDRLDLYYFDEAANKATAVSFTVDKGNRTITFETDHFSRYVLVQKAEAQADSGKTDSDKVNSSKVNADKADIKTSPKTGDTANTTLYTVMLLAAGIVVVACARKRRDVCCMQKKHK